MIVPQEQRTAEGVGSRLGTVEHRAPAITLEQIEAKRTEMLANPGLFLEKKEFNRTMFVAGGGLVRLFGEERDALWQAMLAKINDPENTEHVITVAGATFSEAELRHIGGFYRWMKEQHYSLAEVCVDERVNPAADADQASLPHTHENCGAAMGIAKEIGWEYDKVIAHIRQQNGETEDQCIPIMPGMEQHASLTVLVGTEEESVGVRNDKREELRENGALPFVASLPVDRIREYAKTTNDRAASIFSALKKWNVDIPQGIIAHHNDFAGDAAQHTKVVVQNLEKLPAEFVPIFDPEKTKQRLVGIDFL